MMYYPDFTPSGASASDGNVCPAELASELGRAREASEMLFANMGARLQATATMLNGITGAVEALPVELQGAELADATARLSGLSQQANAMTAAFASERNSIGELLRVVLSVSGAVANLDKTTRLLGILALNAHVVAADDGSRDIGLSTIAQEASRLSDQAEDRIAYFRQCYRRLVDVVRGAARQQGEFETRHRKALAALAAGIEGKLVDLETHRTQCADALATTGQLTREVSQGVTQAVMALQIGDATHQRLSHVEAALTGVEQLQAAGRFGNVRPAADDSSIVAGQVLQLQERQLSDTAAQLDHETASLKTALATLALRAGESVATGEVIAGPVEARQSGSVLTSLSTEIRAAAAMLRAYEVERRKLDQMALTVQATVNDLLAEVETVRGIEHRMRILSLNAAARCPQENEGTSGFDVIAQQLRHITLDLVQCADQAMQGLGQAASLAGSITESSVSAGADKVNEMEAQASQAITLLVGVDERIDAALDTLANNGSSAVAALEAAQALLADCGSLSCQIRDVASALATCPMVQLVTEAPFSADQTLSDIMAALRSAYTMAGERRVHDELVSGTSVEDGVQNQEAACSTEFQDDGSIFF